MPARNLLRFSVLRVSRVSDDDSCDFSQGLKQAVKVHVTRTIPVVRAIVTGRVAKTQLLKALNCDPPSNSGREDVLSAPISTEATELSNALMEDHHLDGARLYVKAFDRLQCFNRVKCRRVQSSYGQAVWIEMKHWFPFPVSGLRYPGSERPPAGCVSRNERPLNLGGYHRTSDWGIGQVSDEKQFFLSNMVRLQLALSGKATEACCSKILRTSDLRRSYSEPIRGSGRTQRKLQRVKIIRRTSCLTGSGTTGREGGLGARNQPRDRRAVHGVGCTGFSRRQCHWLNSCLKGPACFGADRLKMTLFETLPDPDRRAWSELKASWGLEKVIHVCL